MLSQCLSVFGGWDLKRKHGSFFFESNGYLVCNGPQRSDNSNRVVNQLYWGIFVGSPSTFSFLVYLPRIFCYFVSDPISYRTLFFSLDLIMLLQALRTFFGLFSACSDTLQFHLLGYKNILIYLLRPSKKKILETINT